MSAQGDLKKIIKRATDQGFRHVLLSNSHHRFYAPDGVSIVQCSGTKGGRDDGWVHGFISELRRAGYKTERDEAMETMKMNGSGGATTSLGEALKSALATAPSEELTGRGKFTSAIRDYLRMHDERAHTSNDIGLVLRARGFDKTNDQVGIVLARLAVQGEAKRIGEGLYKWRDPAARAVGVPATSEEAAQLQQHRAAATPTEEDPDERELDEALASLGRIEAVVRRWKVKIRRFKELQRLLSGEEI